MALGAPKLQDEDNEQPRPIETLFDNEVARIRAKYDNTAKYPQGPNANAASASINNIVPYESFLRAAKLRPLGYHHGRVSLEKLEIALANGLSADEFNRYDDKFSVADIIETFWGDREDWSVDKGKVQIHDRVPAQQVNGFHNGLHPQHLRAFAGIGLPCDFANDLIAHFNIAFAQYYMDNWYFVRAARYFFRNNYDINTLKGFSSEWDITSVHSLLLLRAKNPGNPGYMDVLQQGKGELIKYGNLAIGDGRSAYEESLAPVSVRGDTWDSDPQKEKTEKVKIFWGLFVTQSRDNNALPLGHVFPDQFPQDVSCYDALSLHRAGYGFTQACPYMRLQHGFNTVGGLDVAVLRSAPFLAKLIKSGQDPNETKVAMETFDRHYAALFDDGSENREWDKKPDEYRTSLTSSLASWCNKYAGQDRRTYKYRKFVWDNRAVRVVDVFVKRGLDRRQIDELIMKYGSAQQGYEEVVFSNSYLKAVEGLDKLLGKSDWILTTNRIVLYLLECLMERPDLLDYLEEFDFLNGRNFFEYYKRPYSTDHQWADLNSFEILKLICEKLHPAGVRACRFEEIWPLGRQEESHAKREKNYSYNETSARDLEELERLVFIDLDLPHGLDVEALNKRYSQTGTREAILLIDQAAKETDLPDFAAADSQIAEYLRLAGELPKMPILKVILDHKIFLANACQGIQASDNDAAKKVAKSVMAAVFEKLGA